MNGLQRCIKRSFDIIVAFMGLIVFLIPFLTIAFLIKCSSRGPVFFKQKRIGKDAKIFEVVKFRTMRVGAHREIQGTITSKTDPRITPVGHFLRNYKLDEFPQLWNVLIGKMSFVGPRPDVPGYADTLTGDAKRILELHPGITGIASLYFINEESLLASVKEPKKFNDAIIWPKKIKLNLEYYENWSFWKDIGYILITVFPVFDKILKLVPNQDLEFSSRSTT